MALDRVTGQVLLYGGRQPSDSGSGPPYRSDTWIWKSGAWTPVSAPTPTLTMAVMAWDQASSQLVLVGATDSAFDGGNADTFVWTGRSWQHVATATGGPVNFDFGSLAFDPQGGQGGRLLLWVAGVQTPKSYTAAHRLYAWDGRQWALIYGPATDWGSSPDEIVPDPGPVGFTGLGWSSRNQGGTEPGVLYRLVTTGTVVSWQEEDVPGTPGSVGEWAFDDGRNTLVVLGGQGRPIPDTGPNIESTFIFDGISWTSTALPGALVDRVGAGMAYDPSTGDVVLTCGEIGHGNSAPSSWPTPPTDTWAWDGGTWKAVAKD
ncbi:MAG TPA: hypothetical protein VE991_01045 [Acidimicrobiales bacterium]|nr:hypothetical protein [Acidimicrobiales bacterium]